MKKLILIIAVIGLAVYLAPASWWIFNLAMSNEVFAWGFVIFVVIVVAAPLAAWLVWPLWRLYRKRWLP